ncbi:exopolygalacturonase [Capsicum galapagoense]
MVSLASAVFGVCFLVFFSIGNAKYSTMKYFNVKDYGAVADEKTDNSQAFMKAWYDACHWEGGGVVYIPHGTYYLKQVSFVGPCWSFMRFIIKGVLKAPTNPSLFNKNTWIGFRYIDGLVVKGGGYLDGQGASAWPYNDCSKNPKCMTLPVSMRFDFVKNSRIHHLRSINSKNSHITLFACHNINISYIRLTAPDESPNTDGIKIGVSTNIKISRTVIQTGDDCIAMVTGSKNIDISDVTCGPGHGISIGSLGGSPGEIVTGIKVRNCTFIGSQNGVRIKTWAPSSASVASDIYFGGIYMEHVYNPILIDQQYCPNPSSCSDLAQDNSKVQISNVTFSNIWGISKSKVAVTLKCSKLVPCKNVQLDNINLKYHGRGGPATSSCLNVIGDSYGRQSPPSCL